MPTLGDLKDRVDKLIKSNGKNAACAFTIWTASDAESLADSEGKLITKKQAENAITEMHRRQDANTGMNWKVLSEHLPDDLPIKPEENKEDWEP